MPFHTPCVEIAAVRTTDHSRPSLELLMAQVHSNLMVRIWIALIFSRHEGANPRIIAANRQRYPLGEQDGRGWHNSGEGEGAVVRLVPRPAAVSRGCSLGEQPQPPEDHEAAGSLNPSLQDKRAPVAKRKTFLGLSSTAFLASHDELAQEMPWRQNRQHQKEMTPSATQYENV